MSGLSIWCNIKAYELVICINLDYESGSSCHGCWLCSYHGCRGYAAVWLLGHGCVVSALGFRGCWGGVVAGRVVVRVGCASSGGSTLVFAPTL